MTVDKAARLAAIRAANTQKTEAPSTPPPSTPIPSVPAVPQPVAPIAASQDLLPIVGLRIVLALLFIVVTGLLIVAAIDIWQPIANQVLPKVEPNTYLSLSRSSSIVGYVLIWLSMALGLSITSKVTRIWLGGPIALELHQHLSILGLLFALFHVIILLADQALDFTLANAFLPFFGSSYRPMWYGLMGKLALYLLVILTVSFYLRSRIGGRWWRRIHYASFAMYVLTLLHGILAGSDTHELWARSLYIFTTSSLIGLTIYRITKTRRSQVSEVAQLRVGKLTLDPIKRVVTVNNSQMTLRSIEARLLYFFMQNAGQIITRDEILTKVWGRQYVGESNLATLYIRRLRTKIEQDPANPLHIRTAQDGAYQFEG